MPPLGGGMLMILVPTGRRGGAAPISHSLVGTHTNARASMCGGGGGGGVPVLHPPRPFERPTQPSPPQHFSALDAARSKLVAPAGVPPPPSSAGMASPQWLAKRLQPQSQISNAIYDVFFKRSSAMMLTVMVTATTSGIIYDYAMNGIWDKFNKGVRRPPSSCSCGGGQLQTKLRLQVSAPTPLPHSALCLRHAPLTSAHRSPLSWRRGYPAPTLHPSCTQSARQLSRLRGPRVGLARLSLMTHLTSPCVTHPAPAPLRHRRSSGKTSRTCRATTNSCSGCCGAVPLGVGDVAAGEAPLIDTRCTPGSSRGLTDCEPKTPNE